MRRVDHIVGVLAVAVAATGCASDRGFSQDIKVWGESNPPAVESPYGSDRIVQVTIPQVDVLFVVDNSCSMEEEQEALGANFDAFLEFFVGSGLDYHVGVVSTDMYDPQHAGALREVNGFRWLQEGTDDPQGLLDTMVNMGTEGHWVEKGRAAAYTAVELLAESTNEGFIRDGAGLHITVVSDEDDESDGSPISRQEFVDWMLNARDNRQLVSFNSIVGPATGCQTALEPGSDYLAVTQAVGGVDWSICTPEWDGVLELLGFRAAGLQQEFFLSQLPVEDTIEVSVESAGAVTTFERGEEFVYDARRNSVRFVEFLPKELDVITVDYQLLASLQGSDGGGGPVEPTGQ
jgi:predicted small secreted protein